MKRFGKVNKTTESETILVSNIPPSKNAISRVYNYFKKYGRIISLWVEGTEATIVYDSNTSAHKALLDPMSFLNNRFIKIQYLTQSNSKANLKQYIDSEKVDKFSKEVEDNIQRLLHNTEQLKKELFEQNKTKIQEEKPDSTEIDEIDESQSNKQPENIEIDSETNRKIDELQKQKTKLIIEAAKIASKYKSNDGTNDENDSTDFQNQIQQYKDQIEEIQAKIDLYAYKGDENTQNENDVGNGNDGSNNNNNEEEIEMVYQEVED